MNNNKSIILWLLSGCVLITVIVIVGGMTRLTHSGLSMVEWRLFMGSIPPLNEQEWIDLFNKYKMYPEFKLKHSHFTLADFKSIFIWEYTHRMLARLLSMVFLFPFLYFLIKGKIKKTLLPQLLILFGLGAFQAFLGWFMVKSGLNKNPNVSHYRLAAHLITAFGTCSYILWLCFKLLYGDGKKIANSALAPLQKLGITLLIITSLQIIYGAFVAGLKAGLIYNSWPMMDGNWIAPAVPYAFEKYGFISLFNNMAAVQFVHRMLALVVVILVYVIFIKSRKTSLNKYQLKASNYLMIAMIIQFTLGILTLLFAVPVILGVLHQIVALALLSAIIYYIFHFKKDYAK